MKPESVEIVGDFVAIRWSDEVENIYPMEMLRAASPSAENQGEPDIFGEIHGADPRTEFPGVRVTDFEYVGSYAIRFVFSDGHNTGLFSYKYLRAIAPEED